MGARDNDCSINEGVISFLSVIVDNVPVLNSPLMTYANETFNRDVFGHIKTSTGVLFLVSQAAK
jgi:hypothetical protein